MGARHKLNAVYLYGCLAVAAIVGAVAQSWPLFLLPLVVAVATSVHSGGIRDRPADGHRPQVRRPRRGR